MTMMCIVYITKIIQLLNIILIDEKQAKPWNMKMTTDHRQPEFLPASMNFVFPQRDRFWSAVIISYSIKPPINICKRVCLQAYVGLAIRTRFRYILPWSWYMTAPRPPIKHRSQHFLYPGVCWLLSTQIRRSDIIFKAI